MTVEYAVIRYQCFKSKIFGRILVILLSMCYLLTKTAFYCIVITNLTMRSSVEEKENNNG